LALIADGDDEEAQEAYSDADKALKRAKADLQAAQEALAAVKGAVSPAEHIVRVQEVRQRMDSDDPDERYEARSLVRAAFQGLIDDIVFDPFDGTVAVHLIDELGGMNIYADGRTTYVDLVRDGKSFSDDEAVTGFLRRRDGRSLTTKVRKSAEIA
jgi:hypothetical protein